MNNKRPKVSKTSPTVAEKSEIGDLERDVLIACEMGNINELKKLMSQGPLPDLTCEDANGRTAFQVALERDDVDLVEFLVPYGDDMTIANLLLDAIGEKKETIACTILRNMRDEQKGVNLMKQLRAEKLIDNSQNQDLTPMMAAAQKNLYEVVRSLQNRGETIETPHSYRCICEECVTQSTADQLRFAQRRLNAYKAITSESYLSVVSEDPINDAFRLSGEMKEIAIVEKHFKTEYLALSEQLSVYLYKLMERVRDQSELECILNRVDGGDPNIDKEAPLARLKMAITYEEKQFVAHPSCQMKLVNLWYSGAEFLERGSKLHRFFFFCAVVLVHPFLVPIYVFAPNLKFVSFLKAPIVKFCAQTMCFLCFLAIIISWSFKTSRVELTRLDIDHYPNVQRLFKEADDKPGYYVLRRVAISIEEYLILVWVLGMLWGQARQLYNKGISEHFRSLYKYLDFAAIALYLAWFSLQVAILKKVEKSIAYFEFEENVIRLSDEEDIARKKYYWLNADRFYWDGSDPHHVSEGLFAIANVLTFSRVSYLLPVNELLGPLQISLGRMIADISKFCVIFLMVFIAFLIALDNLFWYYNDGNRRMVELLSHPSTEAGRSFGSFETALRSVFWGMFAMTSQSSINVEPYDATFTQQVASMLYGAYEVAIVIVLLNMLIAMMSSSFDQIEQDSDVEWKFARSRLYMEFIEEGSVLPAPLNLLEIIMKPVDVVIFIVQWLCYTCRKNKPKPQLSKRRATLNDLWKEEAQTRRIAAFKDANKELTIVYNDPRRNKITRVTSSDVPIVTYREVVSRIVDRFIFDVTTGDEAQEDDQEMAEMRQDLTRMRRDVINAMTVQERELQSMRDNIAQLTSLLGASLKTCEQLISDCRGDINVLGNTVDALDRTQEEGLHMFLAITERVYHSLNVVSNHVLRTNVAPDSPLSHIISFQSSKRHTPPSGGRSPAGGRSPEFDRSAGKSPVNSERSVGDASSPSGSRLPAIAISPPVSRSRLQERAEHEGHLSGQRSPARVRTPDADYI